MGRDRRQLGILHLGEQSGREAVGEHYGFGAAVPRGRKQPQRAPVLGIESAQTLFQFGDFQDPKVGLSPLPPGRDVRLLPRGLRQKADKASAAVSTLGDRLIPVRRQNAILDELSRDELALPEPFR